MNTSKLYRLNWLDLAKAILVAVIAIVLDFAQKILIPSLDLSPEVKLLLVTGIGYLVKNFLSGDKKE